ncbi:hypothetical protein T11_1787 [Trichinella zimbabwensis]|uniref:Uncharacterized protein n=1 Tax=Trichinella zimbabwensis TaxID=268475 RepID=A0A0V1HZ39_9BILA|nr:hypothetical protein T11_1787 [Trichinella zimbabwensis]
MNSEFVNCEVKKFKKALHALKLDYEGTVKLFGIHSDCCDCHCLNNKSTDRATRNITWNVWTINSINQAVRGLFPKDKAV